MKILITGGAGFIGSHLTEKLLSDGQEVFVIDDLSTGSFGNIQRLVKNKRFHYVIRNMLDEAVTAELVKRCNAVYHLAAAVGVKLIVEHPLEAIEKNILLTQLILKLCSRYHKKILITSTSEVYGKETKESFKETDDCILGYPGKKRWSYAASKSIGEYLAFAHFYESKLPIIIVRLFNIIGPHQTGRYGMVVPTFIKQAINNKPMTVYGNGKQTRTFLDINDALTAFVLLMGNPKAEGNIFNIGGEQEISIKDLASLVKTITNSKSRIKYVPYIEAYGEGFEDIHRRIPDIAKLKKIVSFKPKVALEESLRKISLFYSA